MTHTLETVSPDPPPRKRRRGGYDPLVEIVRPRFLPYVVGFSVTTAWRLRRRGLFPDPIRLTTGGVGWRRIDLQAWLNGRQASK